MCTSIKTNTVTVLKMGLVFIFWKEDEQNGRQNLNALKGNTSKMYGLLLRAGEGNQAELKVNTQGTWGKTRVPFILQKNIKLRQLYRCADKNI